jgi:ATP-dependent RNA helicase SUPV3L1/SUV3
LKAKNRHNRYNSDINDNHKKREPRRPKISPDEKIEKSEKKREKRRIFHDQATAVGVMPSKYEELFPKARSLQRTIKFYVGPTNSGKTYNALNTLVTHRSGVYLAPLRLLALEGQDEIEQRGHKCSFITGEEQEIKKGAKFLAQTVETFDFDTEVEAVLIDEIQMLADPHRGWAWTQAIVGAPSKNIILTGSLDSLELVKSIAGLLGDTLEVIKLERFTQLNHDPSSVNLESVIKAGNLEEGTAVITFSRKNVLKIKTYFEAKNLPVSIIYGNLSPEVRREEARKFREGETKFLISTDAIAMGLNLPIKRVIFAETSKFNGSEVVDLTASEVRQIAGRAGRFGKYPEGFYQATSLSDLKYLKMKMEEVESLPFRLSIRPTLEQALKISKMINSENLGVVLRTFSQLVNNGTSVYKSFDVNGLLPVIEILDNFKLTLREKMSFLEMPIDYNNEHMLKYFQEWIETYVEKETIAAANFFGYSSLMMTDDNMLGAENNIKMLTAYLWMANKNPVTAPDKTKAEKLKKESSDFILKCLNKTLRGSSNGSIETAIGSAMVDEFDIMVFGDIEEAA